MHEVEVASQGAAEDVRTAVMEGRLRLPRVGAVRAGSSGVVPFVVVDEDDRPIEAFSTFLRDLMLTDMSPSTCRSYGNDLLRWWRLLGVLEVGWERATRAEVEVLVGWMRSADNPQRRRRSSSLSSSLSGSASSFAGPGSVNVRTGKRALGQGYAPATINHALSVLSSFYAFHAQFGAGPVANPVPVSGARRARLAPAGPLEPGREPGLEPGLERGLERGREVRRAALRQKQVEVAPRAVPDVLAEELAATLRSSRDRALLAMFLSSGARAGELLAVTGERVDWARQQVWVVSKGTRALQPVPASPEALRLLAVYYDEHGTPTAGEVIWRTLRGTPRPLSYFAARRVLQRANAVLGTDWTLHDLRHTTIERMTSDPDLTLTDVMAVSRHRRVASLDPYLRPNLEQIFDRLQAHYEQPRPTRTLTPGYDAEDFRTVFGG